MWCSLTAHQRLSISSQKVSDLLLDLSWALNIVHDQHSDDFAISCFVQQVACMQAASLLDAIVCKTKQVGGLMLNAKTDATKDGCTCILALPHWEMACQAESAPSEMKLRNKLQTCPGLELMT